MLLRRPSLLVTPAPRDDDVFREEVLPPDKELLLLLCPLLALENELAMLRSAVTIGPSSPCAPHTIECAGQPLNWQAFRVVRENGSVAGQDHNRNQVYGSDGSEGGWIRDGVSEASGTALRTERERRRGQKEGLERKESGLHTVHQFLQYSYPAAVERLEADWTDARGLAGAQRAHLRARCTCGRGGIGMNLSGFVIHSIS